MRITRALSPAVAALLLTGGVALAEAGKKTTKEESSFGSLRGVDAAEARKQAEAWLRSAKADAATLEKFKGVWDADRPLLDKVAATLTLGDAQAAKLLDEARDADAAAPIDVPALLKDKSKPAYYRSNLALAYGRSLAGRKVYEEALETLALAKPEDVVDPASYFFHKAVREHALMMKDQADASIDRLLVDVQGSPQRYQTVAALMHYDMEAWKEKDLDWVARRMNNIQRRLDLKRGGKVTQRQQKEVLVRLDEMIKELENKSKCQGGQCQNGGNCPGGGQQPGSGPGTDRSSSPQQDSSGGSANGTGNVDTRRVKEIAEVWGKLPEKDRVQAMRDLTRAMPAKDRMVIEAYLKELQKRSSK